MSRPSPAPRPATIAERIAVVPKGDDTFAGAPVRMLRGTMFGGQILGQCMSAAIATVAGETWPASLQLYFTAAPDPDVDVIYRVSTPREGGRYSWRHVIACQGERVVADAMAAFARQAHGPVAVPLPATLLEPTELRSPDAEVAHNGAVIGNYMDHVTMGVLDVRFVQGSPPVRIARGDREPRQRFWLRPNGQRAFASRDMAAVLAFLSDVNMLAMPLMSTGELGDGTRSYAASFDHTVRFYSPIDELDWVVFEQEAVLVSGTTMESRGRALTADGRVLFTVGQQGLALSV
jgi:acyl-CoA thioesterase-2